ncbi:MAG TPA: sigma-70 family RNA polymerase sigma factor [Planctomycetaceae bacterium]|jgi:hypothetical protein
MPNRPDGDSTADFNAIQTQWPLINKAHCGSKTSTGPARNALVLRYRQAIRSYLGALLKDDAAADELAQDAIVRMLNGDFAAATPEKGKFRNFLKVAVRNMARSYWERRNRSSTTEIDLDQLANSSQHETDSEWMEDWRGTVLQTAWDALKEFEHAHPGSLSYTLFKLRSESPELRSEGLAERVSDVTGRKVTAATVRQSLRRARFLFAQYLVDEVARCLDNPAPEALEEELAELGLTRYVKDFMPADWRANGRLCEEDRCGG